MNSQQIKSTSRLRRLKEPRWLIVAVGVTCMVILTALVFVQQSTVAAPPPPLRGPFRFVEMPRQAAKGPANLSVQWTPLYTQTFSDNTFYTDPKWNRFDNTAGLPTWGRVLLASDFPAARLVNTLGAWLDPGPGVPTDYSVRTGDTYSKSMDAWAVYGPLNADQFARFQTQFSFYLDTQPGARFGWGASSDGTTFCGQSMTGHLKQWITQTFDLLNCPGLTARPVYLAFFFQSSDTETPVGLGAFVDNVIISGMPWHKMFFSIVRLDPTPTEPPVVIGTLVRAPFTFEGPEDPRWCENGDMSPGWTASLESVGDGSRGKSYRLAFQLPGRTMLQSNHFDPGVANYGIDTEFSLLDMTGMNLASYIGTKFGLFFGVEGNGTDGYPVDPFDDNHCTWDENAGGYYRAFVRVNDSGTGYEYKLQRVWKGGKTDLDTETNPLVQISTIGWNKFRVNRNGSSIQVYVNGVQVLSAIDSTWLGSRWWGFMIDEVAGYGGNQPWRVNWDNTGVYNLTP